MNSYLWLAGLHLAAAFRFSSPEGYRSFLLIFGMVFLLSYNREVIVSREERNIWKRPLAAEQKELKAQKINALDPFHYPPARCVNMSRSLYFFYRVGIYGVLLCGCRYSSGIPQTSGFLKASVGFLFHYPLFCLRWLACITSLAICPDRSGNYVKYVALPLWDSPLCFTSGVMWLS